MESRFKVGILAGSHFALGRDLNASRPEGISISPDIWSVKSPSELVRSSKNFVRSMRRANQALFAGCGGRECADVVLRAL